MNSDQTQKIRKIARQIYGDDVRVVLFGSRVDDQARGGDIDLLIESPDERRMNFKNKIDFLTALKMAIGDQKIDVIYNYEGTNKAPSEDFDEKSLTSDIVSKALKEGVEL